MRKNLGKCLLFTAGLVVVDIGIISWLLNQESLICTALGITVGIMSIALFFLINYRLLTEKNHGKQLTQLKEGDDYEKALLAYRGKPAFADIVSNTLTHLQSLERKGEKLDEILYQNYGEGAENFGSYSQVWEDAQTLIFENVKRILNGMAVFDEQDYRRLKAQGQMTDLQQEKYAMYLAQMKYLRKLVENDEQVLYEFDRLLLEVSKLSDKDTEAELQAIQDITASIRELRLDDEEGMGLLAGE